MSQIVSPKVYLATFAALMLLLGVTIGAAYLDLGALNLIVAMSIAVVKMLLILLFFMHLKGSSRILWLAASAGFFWLAIMLVLAMGDYTTRHWLATPSF